MLTRKDTDIFFSGLSEFARIFAIPYDLSKQGIEKHGRQGSIHQWALEKISRVVKKKFHKVITVSINEHTNIVATQNGHPVEVSDGFFMTDGIFSQTACGAIDSSIVFQLLAEGISETRIENLLSKHSGFKALAGGNPTIKNILSRKDLKAKFAREVFCYQILKYIGSYTAILGGLDAIFFIGEGHLAIRDLVLELLDQLQFMGIKKKSTISIGEISLLTTGDSLIQSYFLKYCKKD